MALTAPTGEWTDEQKALRKSLNEYFDALNEGHLEDDAANRFNRDKWELIRQSGVLRIPFDAEWGGLGHDVLTLVYVLENLGYGCRDTGLLFGAATQVVSAAIPLQKFGSDELKERYLARLVDGEILSAHAISEPGAGSDATAMVTTATEDGDDYVINGKKIWITSGPLADVITVYAKTGAEDGAAGITAFLVPTDTPGFHVGEPIEKLGLNTCPFCALEFTDCRVPERQHPRKAGLGLLHPRARHELRDPVHLHDDGRRDAGADGSLHQVREGAPGVRPVDRLQPIHRGQDRRHEDRPGELAQAPVRHCAPVRRGRSVTTEISMAKLITSEANVASALSAIQIFGARGYTREYGLEKGLRDAVGAPIYSGTNETQRVRIASMLGL